MADRRCGTCVHFEPARDKAGKPKTRTPGECLIANNAIRDMFLLAPACVGLSAVAGRVMPNSGDSCRRYCGGRDPIVGKAPKGGGA